MAMRANTKRKATDTRNIGRRRSSCQASLRSERACSPPSPGLSGDWAEVDAAGLVISDPPIEPDVQYVDAHMHDEEKQSEWRADRRHRQCLLGLDCIEHLAAKPVDTEYAFGDDRAAHERPEVGANEGDNRD